MRPSVDRFVVVEAASALSRLKLDHSVPRPVSTHSQGYNSCLAIPLRALLVQNTAGAVRANDSNIVTELDVAATVAANVADGGRDPVDVVRGAALSAGRGGGNLVFFAGHFGSEQRGTFRW